MKLVTGDMRMGLKESLVEEALGRMAGVTTGESTAGEHARG